MLAVKWVLYLTGVDNWTKNYSLLSSTVNCLIIVIINNYWMRLSIIARIIKDAVCVICLSIRLRQIAQTEAMIIPAIMRKPNPIIVLLDISSMNSSFRAKTLHSFFSFCLCKMLNLAISFPLPLIKRRHGTCLHDDTSAGKHLTDCRYDVASACIKTIVWRYDVTSTCKKNDCL